MYLTNKEITLVLRAISEYEELINNMNDFEIKSQTKNYGYSESSLDKIAFKLIKQQRKNNEQK